MAVSRTPEQEIASDRLDELRDKPSRCAQVSVHVGRHPWVFYAPSIDSYVIAETSGVGRLEVEACDKHGLLNLFAENPIEIMPRRNAEYSPPKPGTTNVWKSLCEGGENVIFADELAVEVKCRG